jgi:hypothetical protein
MCSSDIERNPEAAFYQRAGRRIRAFLRRDKRDGNNRRRGVGAGHARPEALPARSIEAQIQRPKA